VGQEGQHLKLAVCDPRGVGPSRYQTWDAIAFRQGDWAGHLPQRVDLAYTLELNTYNGEQRLQLNVKDIRPAADQ
jgi:single-stranded-DNA-specific exonuclease